MLHIYNLNVLYIWQSPMPCPQPEKSNDFKCLFLFIDSLKHHEGPRLNEHWLAARPSCSGWSVLNFKGQRCRSFKAPPQLLASALSTSVSYSALAWATAVSLAKYLTSCNLPGMTPADMSVQFRSKHPLERLKWVMAFDFFQLLSTNFWNENLGFKCNLRFKPSEFLAGTVAFWPQSFQKARRHAMNVHANLEDSARAVIKWRISHGTICTICLAGRSKLIWLCSWWSMYESYRRPLIPYLPLNCLCRYTNRMFHNLRYEN